MTRKVFPLVFLLVLVLGVAASAQAPGGRATLELYLELEDVDAPQISPDGTRIAYIARGEPTGQQVFVRYMSSTSATGLRST